MFKKGDLVIVNPWHKARKSESWYREEGIGRVLRVEGSDVLVEFPSTRKWYYTIREIIHVDAGDYVATTSMKYKDSKQLSDEDKEIIREYCAENNLST